MLYYLYFSLDARYKVDEAVKNRKSDGTVKSFRCKARKSDGMRRTCMYAAMTKDAAQRCRWTFYEAVKISHSALTVRMSVCLRIVVSH